MPAKKITDSRNEGSVEEFCDTSAEDRPSIDQIEHMQNITVGGNRGFKTDVGSYPLPRDPHLPPEHQVEHRQPDSRFNEDKILADDSSRSVHDAQQQARESDPASTVDAREVGYNGTINGYGFPKGKK